MSDYMQRSKQRLNRILAENTGKTISRLQKIRIVIISCLHRKHWNMELLIKLLKEDKKNF